MDIQQKLDICGYAKSIFGNVMPESCFIVDGSNGISFASLILAALVPFAAQCGWTTFINLPNVQVSSLWDLLNHCRELLKNEFLQQNGLPAPSSASFARYLFARLFICY